MRGGERYGWIEGIFYSNKHHFHVSAHLEAGTPDNPLTTSTINNPDLKAHLSPPKPFEL